MLTRWNWKLTTLHIIIILLTDYLRNSKTWRRKFSSRKYLKNFNDSTAYCNYTVVYLRRNDFFGCICPFCVFQQHGGFWRTKTRMYYTVVNYKVQYCSSTVIFHHRWDICNNWSMPLYPVTGMNFYWMFKQACTSNLQCVL